MIKEMEKQYPKCTNELLNNFDKAYQLWCRKQHDYGDSNIRLGLDLSSTSDSSQNNNRLAQLGVIIRMNDKLSRLINLYKDDKSAANESVEDTCIDIMNYANILLTLLANKWGK
jgi:hypothetical protein